MTSSVLPADIFSLICDFCPPNQYLNLALTCKALRRNLTRRKYEKTTRVEPNLLKWAISQGFKMTEHTSYMLARSGDLVLMKWARDFPRHQTSSGDWVWNGCPWNDLTCFYAASEGHVELLEWLCANGCPWTKNYDIQKFASICKDYKELNKPKYGWYADLSPFLLRHVVALTHTGRFNFRVFMQLSDNQQKAALEYIIRVIIDDIKRQCNFIK